MNFLNSREVEKMFNKVAPRYDLLNDLLSFGLHRIWKRRLLSLLKPFPGEKWIDLCCGTGDLSLSLSKNLKNKGSVLGIDFSSQQLTLAKKRALRKKIFSITWLNKDVLNNYLPSHSFDGVVMAYGLRNLSNPDEGIKEIHRLLKPGGRAGILDFNSDIQSSINLCFQKIYLRKFVVPIASIFGLKKEYLYLEDSLKTFPSGSIQKRIAINTGFAKVSYKLLAGGQMGILLLKA